MRNGGAPAIGQHGVHGRSHRLGSWDLRHCISRREGIVILGWDLSGGAPAGEIVVPDGEADLPGGGKGQPGRTSGPQQRPAAPQPSSAARARTTAPDPRPEGRHGKVALPIATPHPPSDPTSSSESPQISRELFQGPTKAPGGWARAVGLTRPKRHQGCAQNRTVRRSCRTQHLLHHQAERGQPPAPGRTAPPTRRQGWVP